MSFSVKAVLIFTFFIFIASCDDSSENNNVNNQCGDGFVDIGEECDGNNFNDVTCQSLGYYAGSLQCTSDCRIDDYSCKSAGYCGDGVVQTSYGEECDGNLDEECPSEYHGGHVTCNSSCKIDYSQCYDAGYCGDGTVQASYGEECDTAPVFDYTCRDYGFLSSGYPSECDSSCKIRGCFDIVEWGTSNIDVAFDIVLNAAGEILVAGYTLGAFDDFLNSGSYDNVLSRLSATGEYLNSVQWGSDDIDNANRIDTDSEGNIYVAGYTKGDLDGNINLGSTSSDIFLTKFSSSGTKLWTLQWGTDAIDNIKKIVVSDTGRIYAAGFTRGALPGMVHLGYSDLFMSEISSDGTVILNKQWGTTAADELADFIIDSEGNHIIAGYTEGILGDSSYGNYDAFLMKMGAGGNILWTIQWGTSTDDYARNIALDSEGNIYVSGSTLGGLDGNSNAGERDIFLTKFDASGTKLWTRQWGSMNYDDSFGLVVDASGNIVVAGNTRGDLDGNLNRGSGTSDVFLSVFTSDGTKINTVTWGTSETDEMRGFYQDQTGRIYLCGFSSEALDGNMFQGQKDMFVIRYTP